MTLMVSLEFTSLLYFLVLSILSLYTFSILANMVRLTYAKLAMSIDALKGDG